MDKVVYLVDYLVKQIVKYPDNVIVEQSSDEGTFSVINITVDEKDIGKAGNIANAIRTVAQAAAYANGEKKVKVNINSI